MLQKYAKHIWLRKHTTDIGV